MGVNQRKYNSDRKLNLVYMTRHFNFVQLVMTRGKTFLKQDDYISHIIQNV